MITFNEAKHTYENSKTRDKYTSATTLIGKFKKPFDVEKMSALVAKKRGVSQDDIKAEWKATTKTACDYGTSVHLILENWLNGMEVSNAERRDYVEPLEKIWEPELKKITPEKRLWLHEYKIAGTTDVFVDRGKTFDLLDFKTNKKFNFTNAYGDYMLGPLNHMPVCEFSTYSLQLSLYAYMQTVLTGQRVGELAALYYDREKKVWHKYHTPYLKKEVIAMLESAEL